MEHKNYHNTNSEKETEKIAELLAPSLQRDKPLFLRGKLGAGKSVFARALIRTLVGNPNLDVPSPTFTLLQQYETDSDKGILSHFDLYRIQNPEEIYELGWEDALQEGLVIIEWPERLESLAPTSFLDISIQAVENNPDKRIIEITDHE